MIQQLLQAGYFREITTEGRKTLILKDPVQVVVKASALKQLQSIYPPHEETGGILYAYPDFKGALVISQFVVLANTLSGTERKTAYKPSNSQAARDRAVGAGALPIRFHTHPVSIYENPYDRQPLQWFQKTSTADRHNSYLPLNIDGYTVVLPDGLLTANDRNATDVRFYLYGGFVAPDSLKALLTSEKVYIYFALLVALLAYLLGGAKRAAYVFGLAAIGSIAVFLLEKRPTGTKNSDGDLIISIP